MDKAFNKIIKSHVMLSILSVCAVVLMASGVSYSLFQIDRKNTTNQTIAVGTLDADITSIKGGIVVNDLYPQSASEIKNDGKKYEFTISNTGTYPIAYEVYLKDSTTALLSSTNDYEGYKKLSADHYQYINYKLDGGVVSNLATKQKGDKFVILKGTLQPDASEDHSLQFFLDNKDTTTAGAPNEIAGSVMSLDIYFDGGVVDASEIEEDDLPNSIVELTVEAGWDDSKYGRTDNWNTYDYGLQLIAQTMWVPQNPTISIVRVSFYYTAPTLSDTEELVVTIPVGLDFENVNVLEVSGGSATYDDDSHIITWTISGRPFEKLTLTYTDVLKAELANREDTYGYLVTDGNISVGDLSVGEGMSLTRTAFTPPVPPSIPSTGDSYTLRVHYIYADGGAAAPDYVNTYESGSTFNVSSPNISGYTPDIDIVSGTITKDEIRFVVYTSMDLEIDEPEEPD